MYNGYRAWLIAALMLTGCASGPPPMPGGWTVPSPPAALVQLCPALPAPESGRLSDLLANHVEVAGQYHACQARHAGLVRWVEELRK